MAERVEEVGGLAGESRHPLGDEPGRRVAGPGCVVGDGLDAVAVEGPFESVPHLDVPAEAHDEEQGWSLAPDRHAEEVAVDQDEREEPVHCEYRGVTGGRTGRARPRSVGDGGWPAWPGPRGLRPSPRPGPATRGATSRPRSGWRPPA